MDNRLREHERKARAGDLDAAFQWLQEANRILDYNAQYQALLHICELQWPGMMVFMDTMDEMRRMLDVLKSVEQPPASLVEEIRVTNNSGR